MDLQWSEKLPKNMSKHLVDVWTASKLSSETNSILVDDQLRAKWPSSKGGRISFQRIERVRGEVGYRLYSK